MDIDRYKITLTVRSSCKKAEKLGRWNYKINTGGLSIAGVGSTTGDNMSAYAAVLHGIIDAMKTLENPCFITVRTRQLDIVQTALGIKERGWKPKGRAPWSQVDLWHKLVDTANKGCHKLAFEHI